MRRLLILLWLFSAPILAQDGGNVHWALASYFGTGAYKVADNKEVYVIRGSPRWTIRDAEYDDSSGERTLGWRLRAPVAVGLHKFDFDDWPDIVDPDNLGSISLTPGAELTIPISQRWTLTPYANVGWGSLTDGSESAWIYWGGVKSLFELPKLGKLDWYLLAGVSYVGYSPNEGKQEDMAPLMVGLDFSYPLPDRFSLGGDALKLNWHATYTYYEKDLEFIFQRQSVERVTDAWEVGFSVAKQGKRLSLWRFNFDRVGIGFAESGSGVRGVKFYFRSVFDYI
jgi:hypothetical protein